MKPGERYWQLLEPHCDVNIYDGPEVFLRQFAGIPEAPQNLLAGHWCQSEVCNGGFKQFFENSTGVLAPEAAAAFETIGMPELGSLVRRAMAFFGSEYTRDRSRRIKILDHYRDAHPIALDPFDGMNEEFFRLIEAEAGGWDAAADRYAEANGG